jgi:YfiH family protein
MHIQTDKFSCYFGNKEYSISMLDIHAQRYTPALQSIAKSLQADKMAFAKQVHGNTGYMVTDDLFEEKNHYLFVQEGDFLITQKTKTAIGVVTADCVPLILYDVTTHTAAVVHAGWKGSFLDIVGRVVTALKRFSKFNLASTVAYIGPSAGICCYAVQFDFYKQFVAQYDVGQSFEKRNGTLYFNNACFLQLQLINIGILPQNIYTQYNRCTVCDTSFCSYRNDKDNAHRQISMIMLH